MAREKQYVFSARTTEEGLKALNEIKARLKASWDDMVIDAVCERYNLDRTVMMPPKKGKPAEASQNGAEQPHIEESPPESRPRRPNWRRLQKRRQRRSGRRAVNHDII